MIFRYWLTNIEYKLTTDSAPYFGVDNESDTRKPKMWDSLQPNHKIDITTLYIV